MAGWLQAVVVIAVVLALHVPLGDFMARSFSAFAGLSGNTPFYNAALAIVMLLGRYLPMVFVLGLAGCLARQKPVAVTDGTLRTHGPMFVALTLGAGVVLVFLTFLPALSLGPIAEGLH